MRAGCAQALNKDPAARPTAEQLSKQEWLAAR